MNIETLKTILALRANGQALVRAVDLQSGEERLVDPGDDSSELALAARDAARADKSGPVEIAGREWFLGVFNPPLDLVIVGAAHIAQPLAAMAGLAGYGVRVIDPRTAFATAARFPGVAISHDWPDDALAKAPLGPRSALVALTHDPKVDDPALATALRSTCFYVGALGSKKTHAARLERLKSHGFDNAALERIRGPVGLAIGAKSPAEIAISILAEMTRELRAGNEVGQTSRPRTSS